MTDATLGGAAVGVVVGVASGRSWGYLLLVAGAVAGAGAAALVVPRRLTVQATEDELRVGRLRSTEVIRWTDVVALGIMERSTGRSGRLWTVAVCQRGREEPVSIPALSVRTPLLRRVGDQRQEDRVSEAVDHLLDPLLPFAAHDGIRVLAGDPRDWRGE